MRVLVVPKWYPWPDRPVFGIFCQEQARALSHRHDVVVLASEAVRSPPFRGFEISDGTEAGLRTVRVRYRRPRFRPAAMGFQLTGMLVVLGRLRRAGWRPDVIHAHVYSAGLPALVLGRLSRAPVVLTEHYTGFQRGLITGYDRLTARLAFRYADLVAPVSRNLAQSVQAIEPRARVRVIGNAVDTSAFKPPEKRGGCSPNSSVQLLTVAALTAKKGHRHLLDALVQLRATGHYDITLELVGDGELREELMRRVDSLGLSDTVRFHGEQPKERVAEMMREADLFVLPSLFENLPCVLIEASASGLACVATNVGDVADVIGDDGGVLCPAGDSAALARGISTALNRRTEFDPEGLAARAQSRFGYEVFERTWTQAYAELVRPRPNHLPPNTQLTQP